MVDTIKPIPPREPLGPLQTEEDIRLALRKAHDYLARIERAMTLNVLPQLRKVEEEVDTKAASSHTHDAADIASGTVDTARLGSGTASASTFLRGDQGWATPSTDPDIDGTTATTDTPDRAQDKLLVYDQSAAANRSIIVSILRLWTATNLALAGTAQGTATEATGEFHNLNSGDGSNTGVRMQDLNAGQFCVLENSSGVTAQVYPPSGGAINGGATNAAESLANGSWCIMARIGTTDWRKKDIA